MWFFSMVKTDNFGIALEIKDKNKKESYELIDELLKTSPTRKVINFFKRWFWLIISIIGILILSYLAFRNGLNFEGWRWIK